MLYCAPFLGWTRRKGKQRQQWSWCQRPITEARSAKSPGTVWLWSGHCTARWTLIPSTLASVNLSISVNLCCSLKPFTFILSRQLSSAEGDSIDVTIPLQCQVKDSKLIVYEATKVRSFFMKWVLGTWQEFVRSCLFQGTCWPTFGRRLLIAFFLFLLVSIARILRSVLGRGESHPNRVLVQRKEASCRLQRQGSDSDS